LPAGRLTLRRLIKADAPALYDMFSNPDVMRYWSRPAMADPVEAEKLLADILTDYQSGDSLPLGIERNCDNVLVGNCTLFHFHKASRRAEIGYALRRAYWGFGYMHEALHALLTYAFEHLDLNRLEADIDPRNTASEKSLERLGFRKEGHLRQRWIVNGEVSDTGLYGLLSGDWRNARKVGYPGAQQDGAAMGNSPAQRTAR
jgi:RimJ/RimL family protein N-acetyltransferase